MAWHSDGEKMLKPDGAIASFSFGAVNAQLDIDDFMQQTQDNIQSTIENSENSNNNNNCDNNISIQSQTNENGKTTST